MSYEIVTGDSLETLRLLSDECIDSLVTDPPAGIGFMNRPWDTFSTDLPSPDFLNWFAGFTDGEGCFSVHKKHHDGTLDTYDCQFSITLRRAPGFMDIGSSDRSGRPSGTLHPDSVVSAWNCAEGCPLRELDAQSGDRPGMPCTTKRKGASPKGYGIGVAPDDAEMSPDYGDSGGASRFFYCAKPSTSEKEAGLTAVGEEGAEKPKRGNTHPTVKSIALMSYLVKLITPPGGVVLDPFAGSGTTGVACVLGGWSFLGIEKEPEFAKIAAKRVAYWDRTKDAAA